MIGKRLNLSKKTILIVFIIFKVGSLHSQSFPSPESKAVVYLCENILKVDPNLTKHKIKFMSRTTGRPSKVYDIANCISDINVLKDSIPNEQFLDSLENYHKTNTSLNEQKGIDTNCEFFKRRIGFFTKNFFAMSVYNAIQYKDSYFVEIFLVNEKMGMYKIIAIEFNEQGSVVSHCLKTIIYD
ncbi:hypothetical protein [Pontibacter pudoricolor]|uniref:hypothetical protein n=1 Tax=Pontibacter pudoricolor TaxID=2694930 RepID=UPI001391F8B4|nr:hypothetical protein [Pontibacter pudoricolor]